MKPATIVRIANGLRGLLRAGELRRVWIDAGVIRIESSPGVIRRLSWTQAAIMVRRLVQPRHRAALPPPWVVRRAEYLEEKSV